MGFAAVARTCLSLLRTYPPPRASSPFRSRGRAPQAARCQLSLDLPIWCVRARRLPWEWPRVVDYNQSISLTRRRAAFLAGRPPIRTRSRLEFRALPTAIAVCCIDVALPRCAWLRSGSSPSKLVKLGGALLQCLVVVMRQVSNIGSAFATDNPRSEFWQFYRAAT